MTCWLFSDLNLLTWVWVFRTEHEAVVVFAQWLAVFVVFVLLFFWKRRGRFLLQVGPHVCQDMPMDRQIFWLLVIVNTRKHSFNKGFEKTRMYSYFSLQWSLSAWKAIADWLLWLVPCFSCPSFSSGVGRTLPFLTKGADYPIIPLTLPNTGFLARYRPR